MFKPVDWFEHLVADLWADKFFVDDDDDVFYVCFVFLKLGRINLNLLKIVKHGKLPSYEQTTLSVFGPGVSKHL